MESNQRYTDEENLLEDKTEENENLCDLPPRPVDPVVAAFAAISELPIEKIEVEEEEESADSPQNGSEEAEDAVQPTDRAASAPALPPALQKKARPTKGAVIGTGGWFATLFLLSLPLVGLLFGVAWACGLSRRQNRIHLSRAFLALLLFFLLLGIIALLLLYFLRPESMRDAISHLSASRYAEAIIALFSAN